MSEAIHHPETEAVITPPIPIGRKRKSAEVIDFSKASAEYVTSLFMTELRHPSRMALHGVTLASFIENEMSSEEGEDSSTLSSRISRLVGASDAFSNEELFDHKAENDTVFQALVNRLQDTTNAKELRDQRKAALKLTELRALLHDDSTEDDETWHDVIDRLFS